MQSEQDFQSLQSEQPNQLILEDLDLSKCSMQELRNIARSFYNPPARTKKELIHNIQIGQFDRAVKHNQLEVIKKLVASGLKLTSNGVVYAARFGCSSIVKYFCEMGVECPPLVMDLFARNGDLEMVKYLYEIGKGNNRAMVEAAGAGHLEIVKYLVSVEKHRSHYVLQYAVQHERWNVVKYLNSLDMEVYENIR